MSHKISSKVDVTTLNKSIDCDLTPIDLFKKLSRNSSDKNRMLLESCEIESKAELKSIIVNKAALRIECQQQQVQIHSLSSNGDNALSHLAGCFNKKIELENDSIDPLIIDYPTIANNDIDEETRLKQTTPIDCLRQINSAFKSSHPYAVFLCGLFSFDFIATFEELPDVKQGKNDCPDYVFYLAEEIIAFDHQTHQTNIHSNIFSGIDSEKNYFEKSRKIETISNLISEKTNEEINLNQSLQKKQDTHQSVSCNLSEQAYQDIVVKLKNEILAGNIFQVVPSRTFSLKCDNYLLSYQHLKQNNPSPYMFFMQDQDFVLFGASPESALKYEKQSNRVELYPIAGTRIRGFDSNGNIDHDLDKRLEAELKLDHKEISEHMMLVDLARNDIARISNINSLKIPRLLEVDRYSQVMHLVSCVQGKLKNELDCFHAYQACMNMGTLTGAPKIKATSLIRETEKTRRGSYGGAVGYINTQGDMDTCIVIRSAFCKNSQAYIQAGAGVVYDSVPKSEADETTNKAKAVINAILQANQNN